MHKFPHTPPLHFNEVHHGTKYVLYIELKANLPKWFFKKIMEIHWPIKHVDNNDAYFTKYNQFNGLSVGEALIGHSFTKMKLE